MSALSCQKQYARGEFTVNEFYYKLHQDCTASLHLDWALKPYFFVISPLQHILLFPISSLCIQLFWTLKSRILCHFKLSFGYLLNFWSFSVLIDSSVKVQLFQIQMGGFIKVLLTGACLLLSKWNCFLIYNVNKMPRQQERELKNICNTEGKKERQEESMTWLVKAFKLILEVFLRRQSAQRK